MSSESNARSKAGISMSNLLLSCAFIALSALCLANMIAWLVAARILNEIGAQCAASAAKENDLASARKATAKVLESFKPDGFFLRQPLSCDIVFYRGKSNDTESISMPSPFVTVKTSAVTWIPAPQFFKGAFAPFTVSDMMNGNLVRFSALHSNPCLPLDDNSQKQNGRSSI